MKLYQKVSSTKIHVDKILKQVCIFGNTTRKRQANKRILLTGAVCQLYFDLEFSNDLNPDANGTKMVDTFIKVRTCTALSLIEALGGQDQFFRRVVLKNILMLNLIHILEKKCKKTKHY